MERKAAMSTSFGLKKETLAQVQARAEANGISRWMLSLALTILNTRQWFRMDMAPKDSAENLKQYGSNDRANLWTIMRFIKEFVTDHENFERWGDGTTRPDFTQKGLDSIYQYGFSTGMVGHVVKMLIAEGFLKNVKKGLLVGENQLLYTILPTALTSTSWEKPDNRGGRIGLAKEFSISAANLTTDEIEEGNDSGVENLPELPVGTPVLYHQSGLVMKLNLTYAETGCLMEADWGQIPWEAIFPGVTLVKEPEAPKPRVVHPAPVVAKATVPAETPKKEVLVQLPEVPDFIQGPARDALNALACSAVGGPKDEMGDLLAAESRQKEVKSKMDYLADEILRKTEELERVRKQAEEAAQWVTATKEKFEKSFPKRKEAHERYLAGLSALTERHNASIKAQQALGIEVEETSPEPA